MINGNELFRQVCRMGSMEFFPGDEDDRRGIADEIADMAENIEQVEWLVRRMRKKYIKWPGVYEMRAMFCSKWIPLDGAEAISSHFPDGIPSERDDMPKAKQIGPAPEPKALPAGRTVSASPSIDATVQDLMRAKDLNLALKGYTPRVREIPVVQITDQNRITEAHFRAEEERQLTERAKTEMKGSE